MSSSDRRGEVCNFSPCLGPSEGKNNSQDLGSFSFFRLIWAIFPAKQELKTSRREAKPGHFQTKGFPTFFGKGPGCVVDPFGTVPRRCC